MKRMTGLRCLMVVFRVPVSSSSGIEAEYASTCPPLALIRQAICLPKPIRYSETSPAASYVPEFRASGLPTFFPRNSNFLHFLPFRSFLGRIFR